jgi:tetratricopeptide (TPR) repeat protein
MKKYIVLLILSLVLAVSVSAGGNKDTGSSKGAEAVPEEEPAEDWDDEGWDDEGGFDAAPEGYADPGADAEAWNDEAWDEGDEYWDEDWDTAWENEEYPADPAPLPAAPPPPATARDTPPPPATAPAAAAGEVLRAPAPRAREAPLISPEDDPARTAAQRTAVPPVVRSAKILVPVAVVGTDTVRSPHYEVSSDAGLADAELLARELEGRFEEYNRLFRFDPGTVPGLLQVRAYGGREAYDQYVTERLGLTKAGAVYLHYADPLRRELVVHRGGLEGAQVFPHQAFIQFFRAFIANPPAWMREGFALYFHTLRFSNLEGDEGEISYVENIAWLDRVKKMGPALPSVSSLFRADIDGPPSQAELLSWALVSFLLNSENEEYFRTLVECFMVLSPTAPAAENAEAVLRRISQWTAIAALDNDFQAYIASRWTFVDLVEDGQRSYDAKNYDKARQAFLTALDYNRTHYVPYYYLGLLAYLARDYNKAEEYYRGALQHGADPALVAYAWGLNAVSAGRTDRALGFLEVAASVAPDRYRERVEQLNTLLKK